MKKKLTILFLLFASLVFLAHATIPHHYHGSNTCFATAHHCCESSTYEHHHHGAKHHHDHSDTSHCQLLQDIVVSETNSYKFKVELNDFQSLILALIPNFSDFEMEELDIGSLQRDISFQSFYKSILVSCQGLRAPPVC